ncbi:GSCOCG00012333001-RA-CDS, partial [Cotesia congregata]
VAGYLVREELQRDRLEGKAGMRAWKYEKRVEEGGGGKIVWRCRMEMRERIRSGRGLDGWEAERQEGIMRKEDLVKEERKRQEMERWEKVCEARGNNDYKFIKGRGLPGYLKKGWNEERWARIARFRLGDVLKGGKYWEGREGRLCRVCGLEEETWEHVWEVCSRCGLEKGWKDMRKEVLGEAWLAEIEKLWGKVEED